MCNLSLYLGVIGSTLAVGLDIKMVEELEEMVGKRGATAKDAMAAPMLAAIMKKESEEN